MKTVTKVSATEQIIQSIAKSELPKWAAEKRSAALDAFTLHGIPNRKSEEYKYLNLELTLKGGFSFSNSSSLTSKHVQALSFLKDAILLVIENGQFNKELSKLANLPKGLQIIDIAASGNDSTFVKHYANYANCNTDPFIALNTAMALGGVFIHVSKNAVIEQPVHILHLNSVKENAIVNTRNLIVVDENAQVSIVESFQTSDSNAKCFHNALTEIAIAPTANVQHYKIQDEGELGYLMNTTQVNQQKQSVFSTNNFTLSGSLVRNNLNIVLDDEFIETHLNGLYITKGNQSVDNHTLVDHRKPNCNSNELYKGIIEEKSTATFNGKIYVRRDAQKTNAFQSNKNILLSDDGTINTKPQLEIYADDVKCSHGTSTGKLDEDKIFYLRARGISEASAKKLLMHAFASEVVDGIKIEELRAYVEDKITARFE